MEQVELGAPNEKVDTKAVYEGPPFPDLWPISASQIPGLQGLSHMFP